MKCYLKIFILFLFLLNGTVQFAQSSTQVEIKNAETLEGRTVNGKSLKILKNNVILTHDGMTMYCDSAYIYQESNTLDAFSNIRILKGDSFSISSQYLKYDGNKKFATLNGNVILIDGNTTLNTETIYYDRNKSVAYYLDKGKIVSQENILNSVKGYYYQLTKDIYFKKEVRIFSQKNRIISDTMKYNTISKISTFYGPTFIYTEKDTIYTENGFYDNKQNFAQFGKNSYIKTDRKKLSGDTLQYYPKLKIGIAKGNVLIEDTTEQLSIHGSYAKYLEKEKRTLLKGKVLISKKMDKDTLNITADSILTNYDSTGIYRQIIANHDVKIFSRQFQGKCDSLFYSSKDSILKMFKKPVYWFTPFQGTAESILIYTFRNKISKTEMLKSAFLINPEKKAKFSQIKGKNIYGYFKDGKLNTLDVKGNAESIYFLKDEKDLYIGVNKIKSASMKINMDSAGISHITFQKQPEGKMYPFSKISNEEMMLPGLKPRFTEKPNSVSDLIIQDSIKQSIPLPAQFPSPKKAEKVKKKNKS